MEFFLTIMLTRLAWEALLHSVSIPRVLRSGPPQGAWRTPVDDRTHGPHRWP